MNEVADRVHLAVDGAGPVVLTTFVVVLGAGAVLGLAFYVWYALALSKLFTRLGVEGWKGWVPILNEATILTLGGKPAWNVLFYFIPIVQIYGLILKIQAVHSINSRFGRGAGSTVLGVLLPPVWASILAWGVPPYPEGDRLAALQPGPRRQGQSHLDAPPHDSSKGYLAPPILPPGAESAQGTQGSFAPDAPAAPAAQAFAPAPPTFMPPAPSFTPPAPTFERPAPPFTPDAPTFEPVAPSSGPAPQRFEPVAPPPESADVPTSAPAYPDAPVPPSVDAAPTAAPASLIIDVPGVERTASAAPSAPPSIPAAASDVDDVGGAAGGASDPVLETLPQPPARAVLAAEQPSASTDRGGFPDDPQVSVGSLPDRLGAAPEPGARSPRFTPPSPVPVVLPIPEPPRAAPAPEEVHPPADAQGLQAVEQQTSDADAAPASSVDVDADIHQTLSGPSQIWAAPFADTIDPPAPAPAPAPTPAPAPAPVEASAAPGIRPAPVASAPPLTQPSPPVHLAAASTGSAADDDVDDDFEATVVVSRRRGVRRVLVLDDGRSFALSATSVVIGRNPTGEPGEQRLAIADSTRTLSKTHARLIVQADEWRLTDLHSTNGVVVVADDGAETLLDPGESVIGAGRFVLGEVGMHVEVGTDS